MWTTIETSVNFGLIMIKWSISRLTMKIEEMSESPKPRNVLKHEKYEILVLKKVFFLNPDPYITDFLAEKGWPLKPTIQA